MLRTMIFGLMGAAMLAACTSSTPGIGIASGAPAIGALETAYLISVTTGR